MLMLCQKCCAKLKIKEKFMIKETRDLIRKSFPFVLFEFEWSEAAGLNIRSYKIRNRSNVMSSVAEEEKKYFKSSFYGF